MGSPMPNWNAQSLADKWANNLGRSGDAIKAGVMGVTVAPGQKAAAAVQKYLNNVQASADKFARNSAAISNSDWQQSMIIKGIPRLQSGANAGKPKMLKYITQAIPVWSDINATCDGMPNNNLNDAAAKVMVSMQKMQQFSQTYSR